MRHEHSYGIIPLRFKCRRWWVYLICHQKGHWSFPKGHPEKGETPQESAQRELLEETGLSVDEFMPFEGIEEEYFFQFEGELIQKRVTYFLAKVSGEAVCQLEEISEGEWVPLEEAEKRITFKEARKVCSQVQKLVH